MASVPCTFLRKVVCNIRWCCLCTGLRKVCGLPMFKCLFLLSVIIIACSPLLALRVSMSHLYKKYYSEDEVFENAKELNSDRLLKALRYFQHLGNHTSQEFYRERNRQQPDIVVCVVTVSRSLNEPHTQYLLQTVSVIDKLIKSDTSFPNITLFTCNVEKTPANHKNAIYLQNFVPYVQKYGTNSWNSNFTVHSLSEVHLDPKRGQELADYIYCLNVSYSFKSPYILMLEDDVVPYKNVFEILHFSLEKLKHLSAIRRRPNNSSAEFSFLKLYYPERWQGYAKETERIVEIIATATVGGTFILLVLLFFSCVFKIEVTVKSWRFYFVIACLVTAAIVYIIGRQQVIELRRLSPALFRLSPTPACCTPAMLYSSHIIPGLIQYLSTHTDRNKDLIIYDYIQKNNIPGYLLEPNLFRHIGMYTSLQNAHKKPYEFVFEMK